MQNVSLCSLWCENHFTLLISAYRWRHTFLRTGFCEKKQHAREYWSMLAIFDVFGISKIVNAKCTPSGLINTKVTLFSMDRQAVKGDHNEGIKARISVSNVIRTKLNFRFLKTAWKPNKANYLKLPSLHAIAQHHNGALRNDSIFGPGSRNLG